jgi:hypothetical protein
MERSQQRLLWKPSLLRSVCDEHQHLTTAMSREIQTSCPLKTVTPGSSADMTIVTSSCSCARSLYGRRTWYMPSKFSIFRLSTISHQNNCPLYKIAKRIETLGIRYNFCSRLLNASIQTSISVATGAGGLSINPKMRISNIVSYDAPAFRLLSPHHIETPRKRVPLLYISEFCKLALEQLYKLFSDGKASPTDANNCGETLLHVSYIAKSPRIKVTSAIACLRIDILSGFIQPRCILGLSSISEKHCQCWRFAH